MEISNLKKALAKNSGKALVTIIRDDVLKVMFGVAPELHIVDELQSLTQNDCFEVIPGSSLQDWRFKVSKPQSAFEIGKAIVKDLRGKGIEFVFESSLSQHPA